MNYDGNKRDLILSQGTFVYIQEGASGPSSSCRWSID